MYLLLELFVDDEAGGLVNAVGHRDMYTFTHTFIHMYMYIYTYIHTYTCVCIYI